MIDPVFERKVKEFRKATGAILPPDAFVDVRVVGPGEKVRHHDTQRARSWTRNFYNMATAAVAYLKGSGVSNFGAGHINVKDAGEGAFDAGHIHYGSGYSVHITNALGFNADAAMATKGIVVGSGDTAFSADQHVLDNKILHGSLVGRLSYGACSTSAPVYDSSEGAEKWTVRITRNFTNLYNGDPVVVKETGLVVTGSVYPFVDGSSQASLMLERCILDVPASVAFQDVLSIEYVIELDFSAIDAD